MTTDKYEFETIPVGTTGWNGVLTTNLEAVDDYLHTYLEVTLGEAVSAYDALYCHTDGKFYKAQADGTQQPAVALATEAGAADATIRIQRIGPITNASWSWTVGSAVYLSGATEGALTQTQPASKVQRIGVALSATKLLVLPESRFLEFLQLTFADDAFGDTSVSDPAALTSTDVAAADADATYGTEEQALINELKSDFNALRADVTEVRTQLIAALDALRKTGGCGVLDD